MLRHLQRHLQYQRFTHHESSLTHVPYRSLPPLQHISQRASIWQEVLSTLDGTPLHVKPADPTIDRSCDEVRRQVNRLIDCRAFTVTSFCQKIGVSRNSYYAFMRQNGPWKGQKGDTFPSALRYLQLREEEGVPLPKKSAARKERVQEEKIVELEGEKRDNVPVFDTCDEVRRKINVYLRQPGNSQGRLRTNLSSQFQHTPRTITISQLEQFRNARGPNVGNTNPVFYSAYVFFEKQRLRSKRQKSKIREKMEKIYGEVGGVNVKIPTDKYGAWIGAQEKGAYIRLDKFGLVNVTPRSGVGYTEYGPRGRRASQFGDQRFFIYD